MGDFLKIQVKGAIIQIGSLMIIAAQNFLGPRLYGPSEYGLAVLLLTMPFLLQGLMEPAITSLSIKWIGEKRESKNIMSLMGRLWRDSIIWTAIGSIVTFGFVVYVVDSNQINEYLIYGILITGLVFLSVATTHAQALAYALQKYFLISRGYFIAGIVIPIIFWIFRNLGAAGFITVIWVMHLISLFTILVCKEVRKYIKESISSMSSPSTEGVSYLPLISTRLALVFLNTGTVMLAGLNMTLPEVATYKVTLSLIAASAYLLPVSPATLQSALISGVSKQNRHKHRGSIILLIGLFLAGCVLAILLYLNSDMLRALLLGKDSIGNQFDIMFLALPFFVLIGPLSAYFIALGRETLLLKAFLVTLFFGMIGLFFYNISLGFTLGTLVFVIFSLIVQHRYLHVKSKLIGEAKTID